MWQRTVCDYYICNNEFLILGYFGIIWRKHCKYILQHWFQIAQLFMLCLLYMLVLCLHYNATKYLLLLSQNINHWLQQWAHPNEVRYPASEIDCLRSVTQSIWVPGGNTICHGSGWPPHEHPHLRRLVTGHHLGLSYSVAGLCSVTRRWWRFVLYLTLHQALGQVCLH